MTNQIEIHGFCDEAFMPLKEAFEQNFADGLEVGSSFAVAHRGKMVVDLWAGYSDRDREQAWQEDTIACVFSATKMMAITLLLMIIDRGSSNSISRLRSIAPEFGAHGKDQVTVRDALTYRALVPSFQYRFPRLLRTIGKKWLNSLPKKSRGSNQEPFVTTPQPTAISKTVEGKPRANAWYLS